MAADQMFKDALDLISEDHREIQELFHEVNERSEPGEKRSLLRRINAALQVHTQIEEELFYPALRELLSDATMIDEAEVEHELAKTLLAELSDMDVHDALFDSRLEVLIESVNHHFAEEEAEIFAQVRIEKPDLDALAQEMRERKEELEAEYDPDEEDDEEDEDDDDIRLYEDE
jgi:hemerythrin superfamily protein